MSKVRTVFQCQACGFESSKWLGRCPDCGAWNSLVEERPAPEPAGSAGEIAKRYSLAAGAGPRLYADIDTLTAERISSGIGEFDRVLGGGVVPGSLVLIGGEPGIGKSTLLLQAAAHFAKHVGPVLYSSGEESEHQIKSRGQRLGIDPSTGSGSSRAKSRDDKRRHFVKEEVEACAALRGVDLFMTHEAPRPYRIGRLEAGKAPVNAVLAAMRPRLHLFGHHHRFTEQEREGVRSVGLDLVSRSYLLIEAETMTYDIRSTQEP